MEKITFIFDLDGTLIDPSKYEVPESTSTAIKKLKGDGYPCVIATGRAYASVCETVVIDMIQWDGYICSNGQHVLDQDGKTIHKYLMDPKRIKLAVDLAKSYGLNVQFQGQPSFLLKEVNEFVLKAHSFFHEPIPTIIKEYEGEDLDMLMIYHDDTNKLLSFKQIAGLDVYLGRSTYADVVDVGQSKYRGIQKYFDAIKDKVQYVAFGDSDNDMDMIEHAFIGVAMGNAAEELKSIATHVTSSVDQDGIALGIEFVLKSL